MRKLLLFLMLLMASSPGLYAQSGYWHDYPGKEPKSVNGSYIISEPGNLAYLAWVFKYNKNKDRDTWLRANLVITNDLDMRAHYWYPFENWKGSLDGQGHTITRLCCDKGTSNYSGFCAWTGQNTNVTVKNLRLHDSWAKGGRWVGMLFGQIDNGGSVTIDNVTLDGCSVNANNWNNVGGFVGYIDQQTTTVFKNCYQDTRFSNYNDENYGGYVGYVEGTPTRVEFDNCVSQLTNSNLFYNTEKNNRGGFIGYAEANVIMRFKNSATIYQYVDHWGKQDQNMQWGAFVGNAINCDVQAEDCYIVQNSAFGQQWRQYYYGFGNEQPERLSETSRFYPILTANTGKDNLESAYKANLLGARFGYNGRFLMPCANDSGKIVRLTSNVKIASVTGPNISDGLLNGYTYMAYLRPMTYSVAPVADKWVVADETNGMNSKERKGKWTFGGTPSGCTALNLKMVSRPEMTWESTTFSSTKMSVNLKWNYRNSTDIKQYWSKSGAQVRIYRNGTLVDSVSCDKTEWTDDSPVDDQINKYELRFVCKDLMFDEADNTSKLQWQVMAKWNAQLDLGLAGTVGNLRLNVPMPNASFADGCKLSVYKLAVAADTEFDEAKDTILEKKGQLLYTTTYHRDASSPKETADVNIVDNTSSAPCSKWVYQAVASDFADSHYKGMTARSPLVTFTDKNELAIASMTATKGESTDKIKLEWKTSGNKANATVRYELSRLPYTRGLDYDHIIDGTKDADWRVVYTADNTSTMNTYTDNVLPGYVYIYRLRAYPSCDGSFAKHIYTTASAIGFAASRGTVMGKIVYGSGATAVEGVDVRLATDDNSLESKADVYSLLFKGGTDCMPLAKSLGSAFWDGDWTLNFLLRPNGNTDEARVATVRDKWGLNIKDHTLTLGNASLTLPECDDFCFVMLRHDAATGKLYLGRTDVADQGASATTWTEAVADADAAKWLADNTPTDAVQRDTDRVLVFGQATDKERSFRGHLDEVRIWGKQLSEKELANTYNRYLTGNEASLEAYYNFDAGVAEYAFDSSHPDGIWNNRDARVPVTGHPAIVSNIVPSARNLSYRSATDKNGEYQIAGVPYTGEGTNYQVVPAFGTHEFKPASTRRYVSAQSLSHSDVNFTDQSAFRVPVQAYYLYGNIPAEGLYVSIDGVMQTDSENMPVQTDADGKAVVSVPIGRHKLTLSASKHTLVNKGLPASVSGVSSDGSCQIVSLADRDGYIDFQNDYTASVTFYDSTFVSVVGRVAGGKDEDQKPIGFRKSKANLGQAVLELAPSLSKTYLVNNNDFDIAPADTISAINSEVLLPKKSMSVTVTTDPETGEFAAMLPPVKWTVKSVRAKKDGDAVFGDLSQYINDFYLDATKEKADTLWRDSIHNPSVTDSYELYKYCVRQKYTLYTEPQLTITSLDAPEGYENMLGASYIDGKHFDTASSTYVNDSIPLWNATLHDGSPQSYVLGMPVFETYCTYRNRLSVFETYRNHDTGETTRVPVRGAKVTVYNRMSNKLLRTLTTGDYAVEEAFADTVQMATNAAAAEAGTVDYTFTGGVPNPTAGDFKLPMTITYEVNGTSYTKNLQGYVLGAIPRSGSNFVTKGPDNVYGVLFDPPGSSSSAYMEAGSGFSSRLTISESGTVANKHKSTHITGVLYAKEVLTGVSIEKIASKEATQESGAIINNSVTEGWSHDFNKSYTIKERISTATDSKHVGAMGDVYFGQSSNWIYSQTDNIGFEENSGASGDLCVTSASGRKYLLGKYLGVSRYEEATTSFRFSQYEIVNTQIPTLKKQRNALATFVDALPDPSAIDNQGDAYMCFALRSSENKDVWEYGKDFVSVEPANKDNVQDMAFYFNQSIQLWQTAIRNTEVKKLETFKKKEKNTFNSSGMTFDYGFLGNYSFDNGAPLTGSFTASESTTGTQTTGTSHTGGYSYDVKAKFISGLIVDDHINNEFTISGEAKRVGTDTESSTVTYGYSLSDKDLGDHFSVDVYMPGHVADMKTNNLKKMFSPEPFMFRTTAGQSRDPWEKPQMTLFYKDDSGNSVALDGGTESMDVPYLKFDTHELVNVPCGTPATVKMTIANNSTCQTAAKSFVYNLYNITTEDTHGLEVLVDGQPVSGGITFILEPGKKIERTVTFRQTRLDINEYRNLKFMLKLGESSIDSINVSFTPQAPAIKMESNDGYLVNGSSASQKLVMKLGGYSKDYFAFTGVRMQYKTQAEQTWHTQAILLNDPQRWADFRGDMPQGWRQLSAEGSDTCSVDFTSLPEGTYMVRAQSFSIISNATELTSETDPITVIKDTKAPQVMGSPKPENGYYTQGSEISITFNEPIKLSAISDDNFYVTAELNDAAVTHSTGLHFDGNTPALTNSRVNLFSQSSTTAMWYKPQTGKESCLLSQKLLASNADTVDVKLFYNADATLTLQFGSQVLKSTRRAVGVDGQPEQDWMYAALAFDREHRTVQVYNLSGTSNEAQSTFINASITTLAHSTVCNVPLYVGGSKDADPCHAEIEGLVVYNGVKNFESIVKDKNNKHNANLRGLLAYWPMDEAYGMTAKDKVRSRNLMLKGTDNWYMPVDNYALRLDGKKQYMLISTSGCTITKDEDFVLEMMFRTADAKPSAMQTLFSNGWGGSESPEAASDKADRMSVSLDENGKIVLSAAGRTYAPMGKGYCDNQWHHLAMVVNRNGYATLLVDTVDISNNSLIAGTDIGAMTNAQMAVGALVYKAADAATANVGQFFGGDIDELRLWNANRTLATVRRSIDERLRGNEPGLVAYYPFERTDIVANQLKTTPTIADRTEANASAGFQPAADPALVGFTATGGDELAEEATTDQGARIKAAAVKSRLNVNYVCSETDRNKIVLSLPKELSKARIEGCTVNFTVRDIFDEHDNRMPQPETWNVYVDQKSLSAYLENGKYTQEIGSTVSTQLVIYNSSPNDQTWTLSNLPSWLTAQQTEGTIKAKGSTVIKLTTSETQGIGSYQDVMMITDSEGLQTLIPVSLTVTGDKPNWTVEASSDQWMVALGRMKFGDQWCTDENSLVAAFDSEGICHGVASPTYDSSMDTYFVQMNIVGGMPEGDNNLSFKLWNSKTGLVYSNVMFTERSIGTVNKLPFIDKKILGTFDYPCVFASDDITHQEINLGEGWNWVSLWVKPEATNFKKAFAQGEGIVSEVKRQYVSDQDQKPITTVDLNESYHLYASKDALLDVSGTIAKPADWEVYFPADADREITWTWLGYPIGTRLTLNEAFADFTPVVNDIVKSQREYAIYNGRTWVGTLKYFTPGQGYIYGYHGKQGAKWHYPDSQRAAERTQLAMAAPRMTEGTLRFGNDAHQYASNATVLARLTLDGKPAAGCHLAAFVDGECRGWTTVDSTGTAYLTVSGDKAGETVRYRMSDPETGAVTAVSGRDIYAVNGIVGLPDTPRELSAASSTHFTLDVSPSAYEDYTYVTATVLNADGKPYAADYELAAFSESGQCRGLCVGEAGKPAEMAIYGTDGEKFTFRLYDKKSLAECALDGTKAYDALTPQQTITLRVVTTGINGTVDDAADSQGHWYTVGGTRYTSKPQQDGIYINNHRKSVVVRK